MALVIGSTAADAGMSKAIFDEMNVLLSPPLQSAVDNATGAAKAKAQEALDRAREGWKRLSYAVARGVVNHIVANMEINGIQTRGDISATVSGQTGAAPPGPHQHTVNLSANQSSVIFTQSNDGTGRVR